VWNAASGLRVDRHGTQACLTVARHPYGAERQPNTATVLPHDADPTRISIALTE